MADDLPRSFTDFDAERAVEAGPLKDQVDPRLLSPKDGYETVLWISGDRITIPLPLRDRHLDAGSVREKKHHAQATGREFVLSLFNPDGTGLQLRFPLRRWRSGKPTTRLLLDDWQTHVGRWIDDFVAAGDEVDGKRPVLMMAEPFTAEPHPEDSSPEGVQRPYDGDHE